MPMKISLPLDHALRLADLEKFLETAYSAGASAGTKLYMEADDSNGEINHVLELEPEEEVEFDSIDVEEFANSVRTTASQGTEAAMKLIEELLNRGKRR